MKDEGGNDARRSAAQAETPELVIPEGFVTDDEAAALAAAQDVIAKALARYYAAAVAAGRKPGYVPKATLRTNSLGAGWAVRDISSGCEAHGATLEAALRNLASQTDADRMRQKAQALRRQAAEFEDMADKIDGNDNAGARSRGDAEGRP